MYGVAAPPSGGTDGALGRVELPAERAAGLLTQSALLATHAPDERTAPIHRGAFLYRRLTCADLPNPPPDVPPLPEADPDASLRDRIATATSVEPCVSCHGQFNGFGFALGRYDAIGAYRDTDVQGHAVDDAVTLAGPGDLAGATVRGAPELGAALASSAVVRDCYVESDSSSTSRVAGSRRRAATATRARSPSTSSRSRAATCARSSSRSSRPTRTGT